MLIRSIPIVGCSSGTNSSAFLAFGVAQKMYRNVTYENQNRTLEGHDLFAPFVASSCKLVGTARSLQAPLTIRT